MHVLGPFKFGRPLTAAAVTLLSLPGTASASGFALPELSVAGLGLSNAIVANPVEPGAIPYNAAAIGFRDKSSVDAGLLLINPHFEVKTASGNHDSEGANWVAAPLLQGVWKIDQRWGLGLGINAPFGLETKWKVGTFPQLSGNLTRAQHPTQSKLEILSVVPTVSYRLHEALSLAAGVDYYWVKSGILDTGMVDMEGDGNAWGWNLGALYSQGPWSFGVSYHSAATADLDGEAKIGSLGQDVTLDLDLPWRLQLGVRYAINPALAVEFDLTRTGWSKFKEIKVVSESSGRPIATDTNDWDDANAFRFGLTYQIQPQTQLRLGYTYDKTGQPDSHFSARVPDNDRHLFSIGLAHNYADGWSVEAGYMYVLFEDRKIDSSNPYVPGREINGTSALNGNYDAHANLLALSVRKTF